MKGIHLVLLAAGLVVGVALAGGVMYAAGTRGMLPHWLVPAASASHEAAQHDEHTEDEGGHEGEHGAGDHEDEHGDEGHGRGGVVKLSESLLAEAGIHVKTAQAGSLHIRRTLAGEIVLNPERVAHIVPRVGGIVREVYTRIGDHVEPGEVMAVLESRELAEAKAAYLAAQQRLAVAEANLRANEALRSKGVVAELDFIAAERDVAEARISLRAAEVRLHTFGLKRTQLDAIAEQSEAELAVYQLHAPFSGRVVQRHIALGELVTTESDVFLLADLSTVWANLTVYPQDLALIRAGQTVTVRAPDVGAAQATLDYVSPLVDEATRTATARATLPNDDALWRPGLFVTAEVQVEELPAALVIPQSAIQTLEQRDIVFVETDEGFAPRPIRLGRRDARQVEVLAGLSPGEQYVAEGAFTLKAELGKESFGGEGHSH